MSQGETKSNESVIARSGSDEAISKDKIATPSARNDRIEVFRVKMLSMLAAFVFLLMFSANVLPAEKGQEQNPPLPQEHIRKLKRIAAFIADELQRRSVKSVTVKDFTDFYKRPSATGTRMAGELSRQLTALGDKNFMVLPNGGDAIVTGVVVPFREGGKLKLDIKVVSADGSKIITAYSGIFKKVKAVKK